MTPNMAPVQCQTALAVDKSKCPLCGKSNRCAMEIEKSTGVNPGACWCVNLDFSADLLAQLPIEAQGQSCICEACARKPLIQKVKSG